VDSKEKRQHVTVTVQITGTYRYWLHMDLDRLGIIFSFSVSTHNIFKAMGFEKLSDLLLFSREGFLTGPRMTQQELESLNFIERRHVEYLEERGGRQIVDAEPRKIRKLGPVSMSEIDNMLQKLGLKFRG